jgi:TrmH family RNA methyltransferase
LGTFLSPVHITSPSNSRIKRLVGLRDRANRDRESVFVVEGIAIIGRALAAGLHPTEIYYDPTRFTHAPCPADEVVTVETAALDRASYRGHSLGVIALFPQFDVTLGRLAPGPSPLILVPEAIEKPGNLGAILRTADAVGADAVIAADPETDPFNPNVIRASTGTAFTVPLAVCDLGSALAWLRDRGIAVVAADPSAAIGMWETDLAGPLAIVIGSEHEGLSAGAKSGADLVVSIPMRGAADSLNASVSAAVLAYEAIRQRSGPQPRLPLP